MEADELRHSRKKFRRLMLPWENAGMKDFGWLVTALEGLRSQGLVREPRDWQLRYELQATACGLGVEFVDAASNDYLGYGGSESGAVPRDLELAGVSRETAHSLAEGIPVEAPRGRSSAPLQSRNGAGASRLLGGTHAEHIAAEEVLAKWTQQVDALLFSSGYAANLGLLSALPQPGDRIFSDALNHASIVDGCRLSKATTTVYKHRDVEHLAELLASAAPAPRTFIVTESYFSMDADSPDLRALRALADHHDATLIVDEAHALGVFGPAGAGLCAEAGVVPDVVVGTLGKAVGLQGAFVAGPTVLREWLWNKARSFVYSTATPPWLAAKTLLHVKHAQGDDTARERLRHRAESLRNLTTRLGFALPRDSHGPIVPILLGSNERAVAASRFLRERAILAFPVRPPTVPSGTSRIRLTVTAGMSEAAFAHLCDSLERLAAAPY